MLSCVRPDKATGVKRPAGGGVYGRYFKRPLDFTLSGLALVLLSPLFLAVAILVKAKLGSPVIFRQQRPGLGEKLFTIYKFRTTGIRSRTGCG